jgi:hypothetical protein
LNHRKVFLAKELSLIRRLDALICCEISGLALQAVSDAQRILEEYLEPRPRNNERIILDRLVEVLERPDLLVAVNRMQRGS